MKSCAQLVALIGLIGSVQATDYCKSDLCRNGASHIGCNNTGKFALTCPNYTQLVSMTESIKYAIVKRHNVHRNTLASGKLSIFEPANKMATMSWNDELAYLAELNVKRCVFGHDLCRTTDSFMYPGQNIGMLQLNATLPSDDSAIITQIDSWWADNKYATMNDIRSFPYDNMVQIAQFVLMAADNNNAVGCAAIKYKDPNLLNFNTFFLTCNYARMYMIMGSTYAAGLPASKCSTGKNTNFPALCSLNEPIDPNLYL